MRLPIELRDRTKRYASSAIALYATLPRRRAEIDVLAHQLLRSGTSVAANVREASRARSAAEFSSKIQIALQEADESLLWIELLREDCGLKGAQIEFMERESGELIAIFVTMINGTRRSEERRRSIK
jgi:four helix bundle protein